MPMNMAEALDFVGPENLRLARQQRSQRRARQRNHSGAHMHLGVFSSLLLMAATTAVLWPADHAFGDAAATLGLTIVVLFLVGSVSLLMLAEQIREWERYAIDLNSEVARLRHLCRYHKIDPDR
jgi:cobalamin biosynthesis protein CobD/CbiB